MSNGLRRRRGRWNNRRVVSGALVALALVAAAVWWTGVRFPARTERVAGLSGLTLEVQAGVPDAELSAIRRGLRAENRFLDAVGTGGVRGPIKVRVASGDGCRPFEGAGANGAGQTEPGWICLDTFAPAWRYARTREPLVLVDAPAHELVHARQAELGCLPDGKDQRWRWLFEGMAVDLSWRALAQAGEAREADAVASIRRFGAFNPRVGPLVRYEQGNGGDAEYARWHLAVRDLLRRTHSSPADEMRFCRRAGQGPAWHTAFRQTFGIDVETYYAAFARALPAYAANKRRF